MILGIAEVVAVVALLTGGTYFLYTLVTRGAAWKTERLQIHSERLRVRGVVGQ